MTSKAALFAETKALYSAPPPAYSTTTTTRHHRDVKCSACTEKDSKICKHRVVEEKRDATWDGKSVKGDKKKAAAPSVRAPSVVTLPPYSPDTFTGEVVLKTAPGLVAKKDKKDSKDIKSPKSAGIVLYTDFKDAKPPISFLRPVSTAPTLPTFVPTLKRSPSLFSIPTNPEKPSFFGVRGPTPTPRPHLTRSASTSQRLRMVGGHASPPRRTKERPSPTLEWTPPSFGELPEACKALPAVVSAKGRGVLGRRVTVA